MNQDFDTSQISHLITITDREYRMLCELIYDKFGINLGEQKRSLVTGRLNTVLKKLGFDQFNKYYEYILSDRTGKALDTLINRISTNHTYFNREKDHFDFFTGTVLSEITTIMKRAKRKDLRIWCPGCSSGEEPYMLAILLSEYFNKQLSLWDVKILATDISDRVLTIAKNGVYLDENTNKLPSGLKNKYFYKMQDNSYAVTDKIKNIITFRRLNLMRENYPFKGKFQVIFCRNVMIYFDHQTRDALVARFSRYMEDKGYLFIGHSETLGRDNRHYKYVKPAVYQKTDR